MTEYLGWIFSAVILLCLWLARRRVRPAANPARPAAQRVQRTPAGEQTGPVVYFAGESHGLPDREYRFNYKKVNGSWRAYILKMPSLRGRSPACNITHRLTDTDGHYVCWDRPIRTLEDAQTVSRAWADNIQRYIATGQRFG